jgi:hypothetical protein
MTDQTEMAYTFGLYTILFKKLILSHLTFIYLTKIILKQFKMINYK